MEPKAPWEGAAPIIFQGLAHFAWGAGGVPPALGPRTNPRAAGSDEARRPAKVARRMRILTDFTGAEHENKNSTKSCILSRRMSLWAPSAKALTLGRRS